MEFSKLFTWTRAKRAAAILVVGSSLAWLVAPAWAGEAKGPAKTPEKPAITSHVTVKQPARKLTAAERDATSLAAGRILRHVSRARIAIADEDAVEAKQEVSHGLELVGMIRDAISPAKVEVEIKSGDKVYDDEDQVWPAWVDVADATSLVDVYGPDTEQGTGAAKAKTDATMSSQPKGTEAKPEELDVVEEAGVEQAALRVNLDLAEAELRDCKAALDADHLAQADGALRTIQRDGVRFTLSLFESPLFVAFDNLNQAEALLRAKEPEAARIALEASARSLKDYGQEAGKERAKEVDALRAKITKAAGAIDSDEIGQRVHGFAQTVTGWLE